MPCVHHETSQERAERENRTANATKAVIKKHKAEMDNLTQLLCGTLHALAELHKDYPAVDYVYDEVPGLSKWWENHQERDRKRKEIETLANNLYEAGETDLAKELLAKHGLEPL